METKIFVLANMVGLEEEKNEKNNITIFFVTKSLIPYYLNVKAIPNTSITSPEILFHMIIPHYV